MAGATTGSRDPVPRRMNTVVEEMHKPAPVHVVEGLCARLRDIEQTECGYGEELANECRSFIYDQAEVKWLDVLVTAYLINGGVILREAASSGSQLASPAQADTTQTSLTGDENKNFASAEPCCAQQEAPCCATSAPAASETPLQSLPTSMQVARGGMIGQEETVGAQEERAEQTPLDMDMLEIENMVNSLGVDSSSTSEGGPPALL